ncbi:MAG: mandelate racemase/muconate lactonizing enzyme family protein [Alphaproteobacteria bacterium]
MKITDVRCHQLAADVAVPFTSSRGWMYSKRSTLIVEIETDAGITGWGECYGPSAVARAAVETVYKAQILGRDPFDVEVIWEHLYNRIKDYGLSGMTISALSGIDIALWDIVGKACNQPIHKLTGGAQRERVLAYATGLYFKDFKRLTEEAVEEAEKFRGEGFRAVKMKIGLGEVARDVERIAAVRAALGPDIKLMVDANHCYTVPDAVRIGRKLEAMDVHWFEEPISPEDIDGYVEVTRALDIAVAGGENGFTRWGFKDICARKAMDIVQPDVCAAGGISECRKIATLASAHGVECVPHAWGSAIGLAATLHFIATLPDQPPSLFPAPLMLEFEQEENPFRDRLAVTPIVQRDGYVAIPTGPGLGIEIDRSVLDAYRVK